MSDLIYHYCDELAFLSILQSGSLRLTGYLYTNDHSEGTYLNEYICDAVNVGNWQIPEPIREKIHKDFYFRESPFCEPELATEEYLRWCFMSCFSENGDDLSQWRGYADDGCGFSIGFDPIETLPVKLRELVDGFGFRPFQIDRVEYKIPILQKKIVTILQHWRQKVFTDKSKEEISYILLVDALRRLALFAKSPYFESEREWRIIYYDLKHLVFFEEETQEIGKLSSMRDLQYRCGTYGITPFVELPFSINTIREIRIGPKCRTDLKTTSEMLRSLRYDDAKHEIRIRKSAATYY